MYMWICPSCIDHTKVCLVIDYATSSGNDEGGIGGMQEYSDAMLGVYMASLTRGVHEMNEVVDKLNVVYDASGSGGRR
jgi:hypothetical protein